jgi:hypothetical protein
MQIQRIPRMKIVRGGVRAVDLIAYSTQSTASKIAYVSAGKTTAAEIAAKIQSVAPKNFITFAVVKPLTQDVSAL